MATITSSSCNEGKPFMLLGDGAGAPILNYNLPQETCYNGNGYFPISIPLDFFDSSFSELPAGNAWDLAASMTLDQIIATLKSDILGRGAGILIRNAQLLHRRKNIIRFLTPSGRNFIAPEPAPETFVVGDSNLRVLQVGGNVKGGGTSTGGAGTPLNLGNVTQIDMTRVNHLSAIPNLSPEFIQIAGYTLDYIAAQIANGFIPEVYQEFGGRVCIRFLPRPVLVPKITIVEHYKMCSFLGDYGAGKTVKTFSLLPGERTTIQVKSFKDKTSSFVKSSSTHSSEYASTYYADDETSTSVQSENILDSYSQYSADQIQTYIENQEVSSEGTQTQETLLSETSSGGGVQFGFNLLNITNFQFGDGSTASSGSGTSTNAIRENHMSTLSGAVENSVAES